jgi:ATP-dependent DNA helicase DinG
MEEFFLPVREAIGRRQGSVRFPPADRGGPDLHAEWQVLSEALGEVARLASAGDGAGEESEAVERRAEALSDVLERVLERDDPAYVYGMERRGRRNLVLTASPIDVSDLLRDTLFDRLHAAVLTSATLAVEGDFAFFRSRLGLRDAEERVVESPFDHARQAMLYLPKAMPEPRADGFVERAVEEVRSLLDITGGRAFLLFTSYAMMERVREALEERETWTLFVQGEGSKPALVERFRDAGDAVLLGTTSFWHGVDVPGDALSLVVIDKLPFDVPSDPLIAARIERIREGGGNPFREYQLPLAVLDLKQGLGRLLRSKSDRGLLSVLDPRIVTRRYGKTFLRSLPAYPVVRQLDDCRAFFQEGPPRS